MFSEIPALFDKNFAIGYLIPSIGLLLGIQGLLAAFGVASVPGFLTEQNVIVGSAVIVVIGWLIGIVLAATNHDFIRFLEGYGSYNPLQIFLPWQKSRFNELKEEVRALENKGKDRTPQERDRLNELYLEQVTYFPDDEKWLLPTAFGNAIRAFEVYPRLMYEVDSIALWPRLLAVVPEEYKPYIDDAKAHMDFWMNLGISTFLLLLLSVAMRIYDFYKDIPVNRILFWILIGAEIGLLVLCQYRAKRSAIGWGQTVKSAFDLFLPDLATKLGLKVSSTREGQGLMWRNYGVAVYYARKDWLPELANPDEEPQEPADEGLLSKMVKYLIGK